MDRLVHDLREPLRSVNVFAELLRETSLDRLDAETVQYLDEIREGAVRMQELLNGIAGYAMAVHEKPAGVTSTSLQSALKIVLANMDSRIQAASAQVTGNDLPRVPLSLERAMQLLEQLIGNALKFRSEAAPVVQVSAREEVDGMWEVSVADNGIGIPAEQLKAVFRPFVRVEGRKYPGVGLGLAICKRIVEADGGRIWMESTVGQGSVCRFTLPAE